MFPYPTYSRRRQRSNGPDLPKHCQGHTTGQGPAKPGTQNLLHLNVGCALDLECGPVVPLPYRPCPHCQDVRQSAGRRDSQGEKATSSCGAYFNACKHHPTFCRYIICPLLRQTRSLGGNGNKRTQCSDSVGQTKVAHTAP